MKPVASSESSRVTFWLGKAAAILLVVLCWLGASCASDSREKGLAERAEQGKRFLQTAANVADGIEDPDAAAQAYSAVARVRLRGGDVNAAEALFDAARRSADRVGAGQGRSWSYLAIVVTQAEAMDLAGAETTAGRIEHPEARCWARSTMARMTAQAGDMAAAEQMVERIDKPRVKAETYLSLGIAQAKVGGIQKARKLFDAAKVAVEAVEPPGLRAAVQVSMVTAQAKAGVYRDARASADAIADPEKKCVAYVTLAGIQLEAGGPGIAIELLERARAIADSIRDPGSRATACLFIASAEAEAGEFSKATETAAGIGNGTVKAAACSAIAMAMARDRDVAGARAMADRIEDCRTRSLVYVGIAQTCLEAGETKLVQELVEVARLAAKSTGSQRTADDVHAAIAKLQAQAGHPVGARATAGKVRDPQSRVRAFLSVAEACAPRGDWQSARELYATARLIAAGIGDSKRRGQALLMIAQSLARAAEVLLFAED